MRNFGKRHSSLVAHWFSDPSCCIKNTQISCNLENSENSWGICADFVKIIKKTSTNFTTKNDLGGVVLNLLFAKNSNFDQFLFRQKSDSRLRVFPLTHKFRDFN